MELQVVIAFIARTKSRSEKSWFILYNSDCPVCISPGYITVLKTLTGHIEFVVRLRLRWIACMILLLSVGDMPCYAQNKAASEYQLKAVFLYNFTQFVNWPSSAFDSYNDDFVIGIIGEDPFGEYLDEVVGGEKIGMHPIVVRRFKSIRDISKCHMLFIRSGDPDWMERVLSAVAERNVLTISDDPDFNRLGGMIRFFPENNKLRLEINLKSARAAQLGISSKLLSVSQTH